MQWQQDAGVTDALLILLIKATLFIAFSSHDAGLMISAKNLIFHLIKAGQDWTPQSPLWRSEPTLDDLDMLHAKTD